MPQKTPPEEILQLTHDFLTMQIFPALDWPELGHAVDHWLGQHNESKSISIDVLPTLIYQALGGNPSNAVPLTSSWLLYLVAARVFDDIQDGEGIGRPWNRFGLLQALPVGIGLMSAASVCLSHQTTDGDVCRTLQQMFGQAGVAAARAQRYELTSGRENDAIEAYFAHIIGTTAKIFAVGARSGGYLFGIEGQRLEALSDYGFNIGMNRAILDDCQDLMTSEYSPSDLINGRYRLPILYVLAQPETPVQSRLCLLLAKSKDSEASVDEAVTLLEEVGAIDWSLNLAQVYQQKALEALTDFPEDIRGLLAEYV